MEARAGRDRAQSLGVPEPRVIVHIAVREFPDPATSHRQGAVIIDQFEAAGIQRAASRAQARGRIAKTQGRRQHAAVSEGRD